LLQLLLATIALATIAGQIERVLDRKEADG
jgi:hypothetical protein